MDNNEIKNLANRAKHYSLKYNKNLEFAEDFSQFYLLKVVCEDRKATVEQLYVDFLRRERGCYRTPGGLARANAVHSEIDEQKQGAFVKDDDEGANIAPYLSERESYILSMAKEGHQFDEIAETLGVTPSRISQIMGDIRAKIADIDDIKILYDEYKINEKKSELVIDWITI